MFRRRRISMKEQAASKMTGEGAAAMWNKKPATKPQNKPVPMTLPSGASMDELPNFNDSLVLNPQTSNFAHSGNPYAPSSDQPNYNAYGQSSSYINQRRPHADGPLGVSNQSSGYQGRSIPVAPRSETTHYRFTTAAGMEEAGVIRHNVGNGVHSDNNQMRSLTTHHPPRQFANNGPDKDNISNTSKLIRAILKGNDWHTASMLVEQDSTLARGKDTMKLLGQTTVAYPLHAAVIMNPPLQFFTQLLEAFTEAAQIADTENGRTPLHWACLASSSHIILEHLAAQYPTGAHVLDKVSGRLPLHYIAMHANDTQQVITILEAEPRAVKTKDHQSKTPLELAQTSRSPIKLDIITELQRKRTKKRREDKKRESARIIQGIANDFGFLAEEPNKPPPSEQYPVHLSPGNRPHSPIQNSTPPLARSMNLQRIETLDVSGRPDPLGGSSNHQRKVSTAPMSGGYLSNRMRRHQKSEEPSPGLPYNPHADPKLKQEMNSLQSIEQFYSMEEIEINLEEPIAEAVGPMRMQKHSRISDGKFNSSQDIPIEIQLNGLETEIASPMRQRTAPMAPGSRLNARQNSRFNASQNSRFNASREIEFNASQNSRFNASREIGFNASREFAFNPDGFGNKEEHRMEPSRNNWRSGNGRVSPISMEEPNGCPPTLPKLHPRNTDPSLIHQDKPNSNTGSNSDPATSSEALVDNMNADIRGLRGKLLGYNRKLQENRRRLAEINGKLQGADSNRNRCSEEIQKAKHSKDEHLLALKQKQETIQNLRQQIARLQETLAREEAEMESLSSTIGSLNGVAARAESTLGAQENEHNGVMAIREALLEEQATLEREKNNCMSELKSMETIQKMMLEEGG